VEEGFKKLNILEKTLDQIEIFNDHLSLCSRENFIKEMRKYGDKGKNGSLLSMEVFFWSKKKNKNHAFLVITGQSVYLFKEHSKLEMIKMFNMKNLDHISMSGEWPSFLMLIFCDGEKLLLDVVDTLKKQKLIMYIARRF